MNRLGNIDPEYLKHFFSLSLDMFCIAGTDGYFKHLNSSWEKVLGYTTEELLEQPFFHFVHPEDLEKTISCNNQSNAGIDITSFENRYRCKDGSYKTLRWMSRKHPEKDLVFAVARDMTEQKQYEFELKEKTLLAEARKDNFHTLLSEVPALASILRGSQLIIDFANKEFCALLGNRNPLGQNLRQAIPQLDEKIFESLQRVLSTGEKIIGKELPVTADWQSNGKPETKHFTFVNAPLRDKNKNVYAVWCLAFEVSEWKRMEDRLLISERMASLGTLAAGVAHEVNNPLALVMIQMEMLQKRLEAWSGHPDFPKKDFIDRIDSCQGGLERISAIVRSLKSFSRPEGEPVELIDVAQVLEESVPFVINEIRHRACLRLQIEKTCSVLANKGKLSQVFINLLMNAAQSIAPGRASQNSIEVHVKESPEQSVEVTISDTGCGIRSQDLQRIFEPFYTSKKVGEGTGLGLAICHGLVADMDGTLSVESEVGKGSSFTVRLPSAETRAVNGGNEECKNHVERKERGKKILIVDDEIEFAAQLGEFLRDRFQVMAVSSVEEARNAISRVEFDHVLLDVMMPEETGLDFFNEILVKWPELREKFVFMTGGVSSNEVRESLAAFSSAVIEKPFKISRLEQLLLEKQEACVKAS